MHKKNHYIDRVNLSKLVAPIGIPDLLEIQKKSFQIFLQIDEIPEKRKNIGIQAAFKSIFPIYDFKETAILDFVSYSLGDWSCKCGELQGIEQSKPVCTRCGALVSAGIAPGKDSVCPECSSRGTVENRVCEKCGDRVRLKIKYSPEECLDKGFDYSIPLKVTLRLALYDEDKKGEKIIKDVKEQEIFFGELPYITERGTFIINGTERIVVSQLQRSPGVYFMPGKARGEFTAKIIPARGAWIEFEEKQNLLQVRLDKKTKRINVTTFLKAMGLADDLEILKMFYSIIPARMENGICYVKLSRMLKDTKLTAAVTDAKGKEILPQGAKLMIKNIRELEKHDVDFVPVDLELLSDPYAASEIEGVLHLNEPITGTQIRKLRGMNTEFNLFFPNSEEEPLGPMIALTLRKDKKKKDVEITEKVVIQSEAESEDKVAKNQGDAFIEIFKKLRPGEPVTLEGSKKFFENMMRDPRRYDLSSVGRLKLNIKLGMKPDHNEEVYVLTVEDMVEIIRYFLRLKYDRSGRMKVDDIDHLSNRRIRAVGELVENAFRIGLMRLEKIIRERITNAQDISIMLPRELLNTKPVFAAIKEFFGTSQLSQFMDQTNALAETTHKRRISALGPGGLNRERAGFEVRDVHPSHYGRICPIETPEGPNIGLISSLTTYARVNDYGFIEAPYRKVENGHVVNFFCVDYPGDSKWAIGELVKEDELDRKVKSLQKAGKELPLYHYHAFYLTAWEEEGYTIAQANAVIDEKGRFTAKRVASRRGSEPIFVPPEEIDYMDISPNQVVSVSAALIPFLEHDDANRALMGSNMQRQAVPLVNPKTPIVGTGMEHKLIKDSGVDVVCRRSGVVMNSDAERIIIKTDDSREAQLDFSEIGADLYELKKYRRSNQNTLINQRPLVKVGDRVEAGQILADGPASDRGEMAMGRNILAAFLPWRGYNYEDAIILSERLVKNSTFNSIYIVEETVEARETKLGKEEITRDIPGVAENVLRHLDESGIVRIGAKVRPGEILVGKVSPKGETQLSPEEKLLRAIFGEQASEIKDTSLYCPPGVEGTVIDVKIFTRRGLDKDLRATEIDNEQTAKLRRNFNDERRILLLERNDKLRNQLVGAKVIHPFTLNGNKLKKNDPLKAEYLNIINEETIRLLSEHLEEERVKLVEEIESRSQLHINALEKELNEKIDQMRKGDEFSPGIIKIVKVLIAVNRRISTGDKMAGRHGNKGVVSRILPEEDMPFLEDGTPLDIILNPLGVPSRMNVGQIYELLLGWAGKLLNLHFETPVFTSGTENDVKAFMRQAGLPEDGKVVLYDGLSGEAFTNKVTVGYMYIMKLEHMVDDKIHARSTGPYSLITQQPLGGKAQFGGQRVGEMEVWAFEAYGAAYILQEILTIKSDNISGRNEIYSAIVKGNMDFKPGLPESFNVLIKELKSLALNVELIKKEGRSEEARLRQNIDNIP
ncbi:MAG: DNA-directed RNA polymerase subunit beta [Acidobacteriota bacterium]|jgi:DNA-directed RNA polymerase subunit beta|nr:DNA-directed RNA polymerase subunit beta [Acidobacteriota bacterium]